MKKIYILLFAIPLSLVSCLKEENYEKAGGLVDINVTARIVGNPETKTYMGALQTAPNPDIYPVLWSEGDEIGLVTGGESARVRLTGGANTNKGTFGGKASDIVAPFPGTSLYPAAYPANKSFATISSEKIQIGSYLPYIQKFKNGTFADNVYPMAAVSQTQGSTYDFFNLCGVIQLKIKANSDGPKKNQIRALYLTGNNHEALAGGVGMYFNISDGKPVVSSEEKDGPAPEVRENMRYEVGTYGSEAYERVIIDFGGTPLQLSEDEYTYINIAVIPQTFVNGFTVEMVDAGNLGSTYKSIDTPITIQRSCVKSMTGFLYQQGDPLEIANSYVYSDAGYYLMPAYCMGNRLDVKLDPNDDHPNKAAALLWSEFVREGVTGHTSDPDDLLPAVTNIEYVPFADGNGMLQFKVNIDPLTDEPYRGNAEIALYDADTKEILWSWHVWMSEPVHDVLTNGVCAGGNYTCTYPDGSTYNYYAEASSGALVVMDRNLGAISANPADGWKTYGLYYQNGRRDPFIGGHTSGSSDRSGLVNYNLKAYNAAESYMTVLKELETGAFGTATAPTWYNKDLAPEGWKFSTRFITFSQSIQQPMTFSCGIDETTNKMTQWTDDANYTDNHEWYDGAAHGTTGISSGDNHEAYWNRTKTIMDPCPVGYSILGERNGEFFSNLTVTNGTKAAAAAMGTFYASESQGYGLLASFSHNGTTYNSWWPAAGVRSFLGKLSDVGYSGAYFHYDHVQNGHGGHGSYLFVQNVSGAISGKFNTAKTLTNHASSIRCVREKQDISRYPLK